MNKKCVNLENVILNVKVNKCVSNGLNNEGKVKEKQKVILCSNNGVCDNTQACLCLPNWSGKFCETFTEARVVMNSSESSSSTTDNFHVVIDGPSSVLKNSISSFSSSSFHPSYQLLSTHITLLSIIGGCVSFLIIMFILSFIFFCNRTRSRDNRRRQQQSSSGCCVKGGLVKKSTSSNNNHQFNLVNTNTMNNSNHHNQHHTTTSQDFSSSTFRPAILTTHSSQSLNQSQLSSTTTTTQTVNHAIKQLKAKPSKSILKKKNNLFFPPIVTVIELMIIIT